MVKPLGSWALAPGQAKVRIFFFVINIQGSKKRNRHKSMAYSLCHQPRLLFLFWAVCTYVGTYKHMRNPMSLAASRVGVRELWLLSFVGRDRNNGNF